MPFAAVGQRCGYHFSQLAASISAARQDPDQAVAWPDPDDRFPADGGEQTGYLPGDHEYFALRSRDRADLPGIGELRCVLRSSAVWIGECVGTGHQQVPVQRIWPARHAGAVQSLADPGGSGPGSWRLTRRAVIEAWGHGGVGVRAVLTSAELVAFLDTVLSETDSADSGSADSGSADSGSADSGSADPDGAETEMAGPVGRLPDPHSSASARRTRQPGSSQAAVRCRSGGSEEGCRMGLRGLVYRLYERRLEAGLAPQAIPRHVGVMCDGNRRWAKSAGLADVSSGHQAGADKIFELLEWCQETGVEVVTLWLLSTDNLTRPPAELEPLLRIIEDTVRELVAQQWHVKPVGALDLLPADTAQLLKDAAEATAGNGGLLVNVAVGYGGRREIADAVRSLLQDHATRGTTIEELAEILDVEHIAEHLYTAGQPDPDLVIRTSGEQRLGGFLLWQSAHSEFYFCDAYWPAFRRVDFLRALRSYGERHRRFGA